MAHSARATQNGAMPKPKCFPAMFRVASVAILACASGLSAQTATIGAAARTSARDYRQQNESEILSEFSTLLALPNLASDSVGIRRNADHLLTMLASRGFTNRRLLTVHGGPPAVYGELLAAGATRTLVLYAHYDGQPLDPKQWTSPPWSPVLRDKEP